MPFRIESKDITRQQLLDLFDMLESNNIAYDIVITTKD